MNPNSMETSKIILNMRRLNCILNMLNSIIKKSSNIDRDQSIEWSIKHMYSCSQLAKILAQKRGFDIEIAGIAGATHDLAIIETGRFENHGPLGGPIVRDFLFDYNSKFGEEFGEISNEENWKHLIIILRESKKLWMI